MTDVELEPRRCGRCRAEFAGDPAQLASAQVEWWLCPQCRMTLLGEAPAETTRR
jgi:hypothetical protein